MIKYLEPWTNTKYVMCPNFIITLCALDIVVYGVLGELVKQGNIPTFAPAYGVILFSLLYTCTMLLFGYVSENKEVAHE